MTTSMLGCMTVEHFDGGTGRSILISPVSVTALAQILFFVLEMNLEQEFDTYVCASPVQTCLPS